MNKVEHSVLLNEHIFSLCSIFIVVEITQVHSSYSTILLKEDSWTNKTKVCVPPAPHC